MEENKKEIDESILEEAAEDIKDEASPAEETGSEAPEEA